MSQVTIQQGAPRAALRALKQPLYDTMECPANANAVNNLTFFQTPLGQALNVTGALKTPAETNLGQAGQIGVPQEFDIFGFNLTFMYDDGYFEAGAGGPTVANFAADILEVYEASVFKFFFNNKPWLTVPTFKIPHGSFAMTGPAAVAIDDEKLFNISNGESRKENFYGFLSNDEPVTIHSAENFTSRLEWPLAAMGLTADGAESRLTNYIVGVLYAAL